MVKLNDIMLKDIFLSVVMLNAFMLSVVAHIFKLDRKKMQFIITWCDRTCESAAKTRDGTFF